jgi:hypothetical protein
MGREQNCYWDSSTCFRAAEGGHLIVLQWAHENGCPWDSNTCALAAQEGHLDVLKWANEVSLECKYVYRSCSRRLFGRFEVG